MFYYDENKTCVPIEFTEGDTYSVDSAYVDDVISALTKCGYTVQYKQMNQYYYNIWITNKQESEYDIVWNKSMEIINE